MAVSSVGMANLPYFGVLPMGISNYGGDLQVYNIPNSTMPFFTIFNPQAMASLSAPFMGFECQFPEIPMNFYA